MLVNLVYFILGSSFGFIVAAALHIGAENKRAKKIDMYWKEGDKND